MTVDPTSYTVAFGGVARTLEYRDDVSCVTLTFDLGGDEKSLVLEHYSVRDARPPNYDDAFSRSKQFLQSCGYQVEEFGIAIPPTPLTTEEATVLVSVDPDLPLPTGVHLVVPPVRANFKDDTDGLPWSLWVVAELETGPHSGHKLVFDEHTRQFGVASPTNVFFGFWGSFRQSLEALVRK